MALAYQSNSPVKVAVTLRDIGGNEATQTFETGLDPSVALLTDIEAARDALVSAIAAISEAVVVSANIIVQYVDAVAGFGAGEIEALAVVTANLETGTKAHNFRIPAPAIGVFVGAVGDDRNTVDITDADLLTYVGLFQSAGDFLVSDGESVAATNPLKRGKRVHRRSRRG